MRSIYGAMTIEAALEALRELPQDAETDFGFTSVASYRGYYDELAGSPGRATIGHMVNTLESAIGGTFHGYKGGEFEMKPHTGLWLADWGDTGDPATEHWLELIRREVSS